MGAPPPDDSHAILCFDFDGTLVDPDRSPQLEPELLQRIADLQERGAAWVINTGRTLFQTMDGISSNQIRPLPDFIIAREHEIYERNEMNRYVEVGDWNKRAARDHDAFFKSATKFFAHIKKYVESQTEGQYVSNEQEPAGIVAKDNAEMDRVCNYIAQYQNQLPNLSYQRNSIYLRFTHVGYSKGTALQQLGRELDIAPEFIFAGGDNFNDLSMLHPDIAYGIACPANSLTEIKEHVQSVGGYVANRNASEGMIDALDHYFYQS